MQFSIEYGEYDSLRYPFSEKATFQIIFGKIVKIQQQKSHKQGQR